jgi:hypothetical protein
LHGIPKLGDICSLESKINFFQRVQVTGVVKENSKGIPEELQVKFLDEGTFSVVKASMQLFMVITIFTHIIYAAFLLQMCVCVKTCVM